MSMNAAELAALIAAVFWALLVCVGVFVLFRLGACCPRAASWSPTCASAGTCCSPGRRRR